jgi:hypothetical protein
METATAADQPTNNQNIAARTGKLGHMPRSTVTPDDGTRSKADESLSTSHHPEPI